MRIEFHPQAIGKHLSNLKERIQEDKQQQQLNRYYNKALKNSAIYRFFIESRIQLIQDREERSKTLTLFRTHFAVGYYAQEAVYTLGEINQDREEPQRMQAVQSLQLVAQELRKRALRTEGRDENDSKKTKLQQTAEFLGRRFSATQRQMPLEEVQQTAPKRSPCQPQITP